MKYRIGIDSGGTHIVARGFDSQGKCLKEATAGVGNIFLDSQTAISNLIQVINELTSSLGKEDCTKILVGIAGLETSGNAAEVTAELESKLQLKVQLVSDAKLALINGLHGQDGTLVIAGTGSIVYGVNQNQTYRFGGWGNLLDDVGSGYQIAITAIKLALRKYDEGQTTSLGRLLMQLAAVTTMPALVKKCYELTRDQIAAFAKKIARLAENDLLAKQALDEQADALATEVIGLLNRYKKSVPTQLALSGSVLVNNAQFRQRLLKQVMQSYPQIDAHIVNNNNSCAVLYI
ncbi:BadF/BadG/BcrA/BcrD ATPase family protein [Lactobacillus sp. ESL0679]|uniref:N-acetylglucosamine kinase n=1 Tax=Lactobacillus sp. ESL0679 TaxID=2983209 RepID=UPI0023F837D1|nr:BadF/BadG/BcrA/BcrD ATPase family protein [Lactobacillus sp. ESL0679]MDF7683263.1 BadF/BadG/BcrA/BcrD ATPase family protein [Lactobacillus sp. ESL0679]